MVKIRLRRMGAKKQPFYRIVVADARSPRDGRFIETVGHYNPLTEPSTVVMNQERVAYWISVGAQPTVPVSKLMRRAGMEPPGRRRAQTPTPDSPQAAAPEATQTPGPTEPAPEAPAELPEAPAPAQS